MFWRWNRCTLFAVAIMSLLSTTAVATDPAATTSPVRLAGVHYAGDIPTLIADKQGFFREQGLDVNVGYELAGKKTLQDLRAGKIDFALMALTPIVIDRLTDTSPNGPNDPVILANLVHSSHLNLVIAPQGWQPEQLTGSRVALAMGTNAEVLWWFFADAHQQDPLSARLIDMAPEQSIQALLQGEVDMAVLWEPWASRLLQQSSERFKTLQQSNIYTAKWVIVTSRRLADNQPTLCRAMLGAYYQAIEYIERNGPEVLELYRQHAGVRIPNEGRNLLLPDFDLSLDWSLISLMQQQLNWAIRAGYASEQATLDVMSLLYAEHLYSILPTAVGIPGMHKFKVPEQ